MSTDSTPVSSPLVSHADVIAALGNTALAGLLGIPVKTVSGWKFRESIPGPWFVGVAAAADALGRGDITVQLLAELAAAGKTEDAA